MLLSEAILNIIMGLIALLIPAAAVLAFVLLMAAWALVSGGLMVAAAVKLHATHGRWWLGLERHPHRWNHRSGESRSQTES
jgi:uncharacterized membrane protein HdeD (DUF308 family)